jgi:hypothetical protein
MTPVVNAAVGEFTTPSPGQTVNALDSIEVTWYAVKRENPSAVCHRRSSTAGITAGPSPTARAWMVLTATLHYCTLMKMFPVRVAASFESGSI